MVAVSLALSPFALTRDCGHRDHCSTGRSALGCRQRDARVLKRAAGPEPRSLTGSRAARPLAPGTSASLARAGAANGGAGPGARPGRRGRGPGAARGAAAVAVTSREGVGAARRQPDYKRTRPATTGVARRCVSAAFSACACSFFPSSSRGGRGQCGGVCSTTFQESSETRLRGGRVARGGHLGSRRGAPSARGRPGFAVAAPAASAAAAAAAAWCQAVGRPGRRRRRPGLSCRPRRRRVPCAATAAPRAPSFPERTPRASSKIFITLPPAFLSPRCYFLHKEKKSCVESVP